MKNFINNLIEQIKLNGNNDSFSLTIPFKFFNNEYPYLTLTIIRSSDNYYHISDEGYTFKYLQNLDIDFNSYKDKVEIICNLFSLKIEDNKVLGIIGYGTNQLYIQLFNYLQGISHLSTIKYID